MARFYAVGVCRYCGVKLINGAVRFCNRKCRMAQIEKGKKTFRKVLRQRERALQLSGPMFDYQGNAE